LLSGSCWSLDLEDGWQGMRGTIIENNIFRMYGYNKRVGDYRGKDTGILALSGGHNTFVISNYLGSISQQWQGSSNTHIINNVVYSMFSDIDPVNNITTDLRAKGFAHVYYNIMADQGIQENTTANGVVYHHGNKYMSGISKW
jgi:hypothetical protein